MIEKESYSLHRLAALLLMLAFSVSLSIGQTQNPGVILLDGYKIRSVDSLGVLSGAGEIFDDNGFVLSFEEGFSQGYAADKTNIRKYSWFREQRISERTFYIAFVKDEKRVNRSVKPGKRNEYGTLLVSVPLSDQPNHAINFRARIASEQELIDSLLMVLSYKPRPSRK